MQWERPKQLFARTAPGPQGWVTDALLTIGADGIIEKVESNAKPQAGVPAFDALLPGMSDVHSHAFQRAMAGLTETASGEGKDNFWSWREVMYRYTRRLTPEEIESVAKAFYVELLAHGYTAVGEFHYLHHDADGKPYANIAELSDRIVAGAKAAGIHLTHLPVMYETGNFGGAPATEGQKRFLHSADGYLKLIEALVKKYGKDDDVTLGIAPHSLRAVTPETLKKILDALPALNLSNCPVHMHVAEQVKEVDDCLSWSKQRPAEWLMNNHEVGARWCLIHATHMTESETKKLAASNAVAGLCPTTEANLGDGIFPAEAYHHAGGRLGIGSDSNVCVSPWEELRSLEYAQRLITRKRNVLFDKATPSVGRTLYMRAAEGGAQALGIKAGKIAKGYRADLAAYSLDDPLLAERKGDAILDTLMFGLRARPTDVFVAGKRVVAGGRHTHAA